MTRSSRIPLRTLWIVALGPALVVWADPLFEHGYTLTSTHNHDRLSQLTYLAAYAAIIAALLQATKSRANALQPRLWLFGIIGYGVMLGLSGWLQGDSNLRYVVLPGLLFAATREPRPVKEVTQSARYVLRVFTVGSLLLLITDYHGAIWSDNGRTLFGVDQLAGLTRHPNALGPIAALALAVELAPAVKRRSFLGAGCAVTCLLLAQSRAGWLTGGVVLLVAVTSRASRHVGWLSLYALACVFFGVLAVANPGVFGERGLNGRENIWTVAYGIFKGHRAIGAGPSAFSANFRDQLSNALAAVAGQAHNQYLETLATAGLLGAVLLVLFVLGALALAWRRWRNGDWLPMAALLVVLVDSIFEAPLQGLISSWLVLTVTVVMLLASKPQTAVPVASRHVVPSEKTGLLTVVS